MTRNELLERLETLKTEQEAKACLGCHYIKPECEKTCVIIEEAIKAIKKRPAGAWIEKDVGIAMCSCCGHWTTYCTKMKYCPSCGARMKKE